MSAASYGSPRPAGGHELWAWLFMRISGLVLLVLALGHLVIMHLIHNVDTIDYNFVAGRYATLFWRGYDLTMVVLGLLHGFNGLKILVDDYIHPPAVHKLATALLYIVCGGFLMLGVLVILLFKPVSAP